MASLFEQIAQIGARGVTAEQRKNSLVNELEIGLLGQAEQIEKIDALLNMPDQLTKDEQYMLLVLKADIMKCMDEVSEVIKKL